MTAANVDELARQVDEQKAKWGRDPEPLQREFPVPADYPVDALGEVLGPMCRMLNRIVRAPMATCAHSLLAAAALVAQALYNVEIDGREIPLSLFLISILESGGRKSAADKFAMAPLALEEQMAIDRYRGEWSSYEADLAAWNSSKTEALKKGKNREAKRDALESLGPKPDQPMDQMMTAEEPTYEGIVKGLMHRPYTGLFSDEGGRFLGGHAMQSENRLKTMAGLSSLWDGQKITRSRSGDGHTVMYGRRTSLHLMLQPDVAWTFIGDQMAIGQGILGRCPIAAPESTIGEQLYVKADPTATAEYRAYSEALVRLYLQPMPLGEAWALNPAALHLDPTAEQQWTQFHDYIQKHLKDDGELRTISSFAAKAAEHALRFAGVIHAVSDPNTMVLNTEAMGRGIELVQYYLGEAVRLHGASQADPDLLMAEKLLKWMQGQPGGIVPVVRIYQRGPTEFRTGAAAKKTLKILEDHGLARSVEGGATFDGRHHRKVWEVRV